MSYTLLEALMQVHGVSTHEKMACYCSSCVEENWDDCESTKWVDKWDIQVLDPIDTYRPPQALEMVEMDSSIDFDRLLDLVQPGNIYIYIYISL